MSTPTLQQILAERRREVEETGRISLESRLLDAIFGYEVGRSGHLTYERWDRDQGVVFRVYVGRVFSSRSCYAADRVCADCVRGGARA